MTGVGISFRRAMRATGDEARRPEESEGSETRTTGAEGHDDRARGQGERLVKMATEVKTIMATVILQCTDSITFMMPHVGRFPAVASRDASRKLSTRSSA